MNRILILFLLVTSMSYGHVICKTEKFRLENNLHLYYNNGGQEYGNRQNEKYTISLSNDRSMYMEPSNRKTIRDSIPTIAFTYRIGDKYMDRIKIFEIKLIPSRKRGKNHTDVLLIALDKNNKEISTDFITPLANQELYKQALFAVLKNDKETGVALSEMLEFFLIQDQVFVDYISK